MEVNRIELIEALTKIKPGIASKEYLEQSTHFILDNDFIISYNDEISISYPFKIGVSCTIEEGMLYKLVSKMEEDIVSFELKENILRIKCGDVKAKLPVVIDSQIIDYVNKLSDEHDKLDWHALPKDFIDAVKLCAFSASTDKTINMLSCVWVEGKDVLSFDKYRASWYQMEKEVQDNFYIEADHITKIGGFEDPIEYCISKAWAHFQMGTGVVFSARLVLPDKLLDLRSKFDGFEHDTRISLPDNLGKAVDIVALAIEKREKLDQKITLEFGEDLIRCIGSSERGTIEQEVHLDKSLTCDPFAFEAAPRSMMEVLDKVDYLLVGKKAGMFRSKEKKGFQHMIGLIMKE